MAYIRLPSNLYKSLAMRLILDNHEHNFRKHDICRLLMTLDESLKITNLKEIPNSRLWKAARLKAKDYERFVRDSDTSFL